MTRSSMTDEEVLEMSELGQKPRWLQPKSTSYTKYLVALLVGFITSILLLSFQDHIPSLSVGQSGYSLSKGDDACNPFAEPGVLSVDTFNMTGNYWQPFDPRCKPSRLFDSVLAEESLPWLENRTVVQLGSSVDRLHIHFFCWMLNATLELIQEKDPRTPPPFKNGFDEYLKSGGRPTSDWLARPWVCTVPKYNFVLYNVFSYGVMEATDWSPEWYNEQMHYYAPFSTPDRVEHILKPLAKNLKRPQVDVVSVSASLWDAMWLQNQQNETLHLPINSTSFAKDPRLLLQYSQRLSSTIRKVSKLLPSTLITFRTGQLPRDNFIRVIPQDIVRTIDNVGQAIVRDLKAPTEWLPWFSNATTRAQEKKEAKQLDLATRLRLDHSGDLLSGMQRFLMEDGLHPAERPGGKIWADSMLFELRRSVLLKQPELVEPGDEE